MGEAIVNGDRYFMDPATYDEVYGGFTADVPFAVGLLRQAGGPALEVCCGNGRLLVPALRAGLVCEGLDFDAAMLRDLRRKLAAEGLTTPLHEADMRDFALVRRYALILVAFNSFLHNLTQGDQLATLECCRRHLSPGGRLAVVIFHPSAEKLIAFSAAEQLNIDRPLGEGRIRVWDRAEDDRVEQTRTVTRRIQHLDAAGTVTSEKILRFPLRYVFKPEMELLLRVAGYSRWQVRPLFSDYADPASGAGERPAREGDHLLWEAWA